MSVTSNAPLVAVSFLLALIAGYVALDVANRVSANRRGLHYLWILGGAAAVGTGLFTAHFVGTYAIELPGPSRYSVPELVVSLAAALVAALALTVTVSGKRLGVGRAVVGGTVMGCALALRHFAGFAAMRSSATPTWDVEIIVKTVIVAIVVATGVITLVFLLRSEARHITLRKALSALAIGGVVAMARATGIASAAWSPDHRADYADSSPETVRDTIAVDSVTVGAVVTMALAWLLFTSALALVDRQLMERARALRDSERRYRLVFQQSLTGHYRSTPDGRLLECNDAFVRIFGYSSPEECAAHFMQEAFAAADDRAQFIAELEGGGEVVDREREMRRRDGTPVWILEHATLVAAKSDRTAVIDGSVIDISSRKAAEGAMAKAMAASDSANRAKSEFLANMSHEIRTPLNGILGMAEVIQRTDLTPEHREMVDLIRVSAESLTDIINEILDFSKIESGKLSLDPVAFDLADLIEDAVRTLAPRAHMKGLELVCDVSPELPRRVVGDPGRIRQILLNLLSNALKFTSAGEVVVRAEAESEIGDELAMHLSVRDTGIGIAPNKQSVIFDAFTQADATTTRHYGGTGLGLTITTHLLELMRGKLTLESALGEGSTFHVRLSLPIVAARDEPPPPKLLLELSGLRVLVVDDNATNRRILDSTLRHWRLRPVLVDSGSLALETLAAAHREGRAFGLVLLDYQMPDMDGFDVAAAIHRDPALGDATIMMLSSVGERGDSQRCREVGVSAYLTKPIRQSVLLDAILVLAGRETPSASLRRKAVYLAGTGNTGLVTQHTLRRAAQPLRVLLAEDNPVNQMVATKMLESRGHHVTVAATGREAADRSGGERFDLILMDVQMPELDGREATVEIRARELRLGAQRRLPIIAVTASAMKSDRDLCFAAGMDGYLTKPIRYDEFIAEVERVTAPNPATLTEGILT